MPMGFPRSSGRSTCSQDAKKELKSTARVRRGMTQRFASESLRSKTETGAKCFPR